MAPSLKESLHQLTRPRVNIIQGKQPVMEEGMIKYIRAPEISWYDGEQMWLWGTQRMNGINRFNAQILVLPTWEGTSAPNNFFSYLENQIVEGIPLGRYPPAIPNSEYNHPDDNPYMKLDDVDKRTESIYVVASLRNTADLIRLKLIGDYFKGYIKKPKLTVLITGAGFLREDKNLDDNALTARMAMRDIAQLFDRALIIEPHSSGAQAFAALFGLPVAPISPWEYLINYALDHGWIKNSAGLIVPTLDVENFIDARPDQGRNLAALRVAEKYRLEEVSFEKERLNSSKVKFYPLNELDQQKILGKIIFVYDDELSTAGTVNGLARFVKVYGGQGVYIIAPLIKLTGDWVDNINDPNILAVIGSDALVPIGNPKLTNKLLTVPLSPFIEDIITADMNNVNFWKPPWDRTILQPRPGTNEV